MAKYTSTNGQMLDCEWRACQRLASHLSAVQSVYCLRSIKSVYKLFSQLPTTFFSLTALTRSDLIINSTPVSADYIRLTNTYYYH